MCVKFCLIFKEYITRFSAFDPTTEGNFRICQDIRIQSPLCEVASYRQPNVCFKLEPISSMDGVGLR